MSSKRRAEAEPASPGSAPAAKRAATSSDPAEKRMRVLKDGTAGRGPVVFWMSRDQRLNDNWALLYAIKQAQKPGGPQQVAVAFNLVTSFLGAGARQFGFMLRGLRELEPKLRAKGIKFFLLKGDPTETVPELVSRLDASLLVTDYSPLRLGRQWKTGVCEAVSVPVHEVDAHNIVPVWVASDKREIAARTIRPKIHKLLPEFLTEFPEVPTLPPWTHEVEPDPIDWDGLLAEVLARGADVPEVDWCKPGEDAAMAALTGPTGFLSANRLKLYSVRRNDPAFPRALSGLSPYMHFGQLAPQRAALEAAKHRHNFKEAVESFLEELIVRRELSDNFCHYTPNYDSLDCAAEWAKESLDKHRDDYREFIYVREELELGQTHDELWNASQLEMVHLGKMHGFMRMYWAKKILEWTYSPEEAIEVAIYLNDKYELDGRDPSGYTGVMWSMAGIHDMGWKEREIFGKIRYMNYAGCKRKFDIKAYVKAVSDRVAQVTNGKVTVTVANPKAKAKAKAKAQGKPETEAPAKAKRGSKGILNYLKGAAAQATGAATGGAASAEGEADAAEALPAAGAGPSTAGPSGSKPPGTDVKEKAGKDQEKAKHKDTHKKDKQKELKEKEKDKGKDKEDKKKKEKK